MSKMIQRFVTLLSPLRCDATSWYAALLACWLSYGLAQTDYDYGDPTPEEQAHLESINRARADPLAEAARLGIDLFEGTEPGAISAKPSPPLASHATLLALARRHSQAMLAQNFFSHTDREGLSPFDRAERAGYFFEKFGENIARVGTTGASNTVRDSLKLHDLLFIDENYPQRGHRVNLLDPEYREIGVGLAYGPLVSDGRVFNSSVVTVDFGARPHSEALLTGVVYEDRNNNARYDAGEGVPGVEVAISETGATTRTAQAGGYALPLSPGRYQVMLHHPVWGTLQRVIAIERYNVKLDAKALEWQTDATSSAHYDSRSGALHLPTVRVIDDTGRTMHYRATLQLIASNPVLRFAVTDLQILPGDAPAIVSAKYHAMSARLHIDHVAVVVPGETQHYRAVLDGVNTTHSRIEFVLREAELLP